MYTPEEYYHKADNLLRSSCIKLQTIFYIRWKQARGTDWSPNLLEEFRTGPGRGVFSKAKSIQKKMLESGNIEEWDIPLLADILVNALPTGESTDAAEREQENSAITALRKLRDNLAHNPRKKLTAQGYQECENAFRSAMLCIGDTTEAQVEKMINLAGTSSSEVALEKSQQIQEKADKAARAGNINKAIEHYDDALMIPSLLPVDQGKVFEKRAEAFLLLAKESDNSMDAFTQADKDVDQALECNPNSWSAHYIKGNISRDTQKPEEALDHFTRALAISPSQSTIRHDLDTCRLLTNSLEDYCDPNRMPMTLSEWVKNFTVETGGTPMTDEKLLEMNQRAGELLPGQDLVGKARQYYFGWCVPHSYPKAAEYYAKAAKLKNAEGMFWLATLHLYGTGIKQDIDYALELLLEAADMPAELQLQNKNITVITQETNFGVYAAQHALGLLHAEGVRVPLDYAKAIYWYKKAVKNGSGQAAVNLGNMYWDGKGLPRNAKMAAMHWRKALQTKRNMYAADALSAYYYEQQEYALCKTMYAKAIEFGYDNHLANKDTFFRRLDMLEARRKPLEEEIVEFERAEGLDSHKMTFQERIDRKVSYVKPELAKYIKLLRELHDVNSSTTQAKWPGQFREYNEIELILKARTSTTAQRIIKTLEHNIDFVKYWGKGPPFSEEEATQIIDELYNCVTTEHYVFQQFVPGGYEFLEDMLRMHGNSTSELDKKIRLCYGVLLKERDTKVVVAVLLEALRRYPDEIHFYFFLSSIYGTAKKFEEGLKMADEGLSRDPKNSALLHTRTTHLRFMDGVSKEEIRAAFKEFLKHAEQDDRHVPDSLYQIAYSYSADKFDEIVLTKEKEEWKSLVDATQKYFRLGKAAEKKLLSCFLPYESIAKKFCAILDEVMGGSDPDPSANSATSAPEAEARLYLLSPIRIKLVKTHRKEIKRNRDLQPSISTNIRRPPRLDNFFTVDWHNLTPIYLREIDPTTDQIYENRMLNLTMIEDPLLGYESIHLVAEDDNGDATQLYVYNVPQNDETTNKLGFGCRISIANPYHRICANKEKAIRVDNPNSLSYKEKVANKCRYCGEKDALHTCGSCKKASYCSRTCQEKDWKKLSHKMICVL